MKDSRENRSAEDGGGLRGRWAQLQLRLDTLRRHHGFRKAPVTTLWRLGWWRLCCWLRVGAEIKLPRWNARFFLPPRWGGEGTTMIFALRERYEKELEHLDRFVSAGDVVVDAGANCGIYTVAAAKLVGKAGRVLAFEPGDRVAEVLARNIELNGLENVRVFRQALSDRSGTARLYRHRGPVASSIAAEDGCGDDYDEIETITLDAALAEARIDRVDFLKIDIEGAEEPAFRGGDEMFRKSHPVVVFEMNASAAARFQLAANGAWEHLERLGYGFFEMDDAGGLVPLDAPPPEDRQEFLNIVAIHAEDQPRFSRPQA